MEFSLGPVCPDLGRSEAETKGRVLQEGVACGPVLCVMNKKQVSVAVTGGTRENAVEKTREGPNHAR